MNENNQIDLFGEIIETKPGGKTSSRKKNNNLITIKWSFSRRNVFETCLRKYYYQYYAAKLEGAGSRVNFDSVKFLKGLSNQHLVSGKIIHNLIRLYLTKAKSGTELSLDWMKQRAKEKIQQSIDYSNALLLGKEIKFDYPPFVLQEVYVETNVIKDIYQEVEVKVFEALKNFMESAQFEQFRTAGKLAGSFVEKKFRIQLNDEVVITGEADLAYLYQDGFIICDWKTGKVDDGQDSMQLLTYTWWAIDQAGANKEKIKIYKAYLGENSLKEFSLSEREIFRNKLAIRQSAEAMLEMAQFGEAGDELAFTPCRQPKICSLCAFQKICK
ncbi:MAG: PD-(D/E)XK nuclease family protein [Bacteroidetes bacterium]|nr:PD-(D/E)XK nuclease family protein [Bacteroidota bacterium]